MSEKEEITDIRLENIRVRTVSVWWDERWDHRSRSGDTVCRLYL